MKENLQDAMEGSGVELGLLAELLRGAQDMKLILTFGPQENGRDASREEAENRASQLLIRLGIKPKLKGYQYLKTAVHLCLEDREELDGITKRLYPSVAKLHQTSAEKVEHAIRHAIEVSWKRGKAETQRELFGYDCREGRRPTNMEFIMQILEYLDGESGGFPEAAPETDAAGQKIVFGC